MVPEFDATLRALDNSRGQPSAGILNTLIKHLAVEGQTRSQSVKSKADAYVGFKIYYELVKLSIQQRENSASPIVAVFRKQGVPYDLAKANFKGFLSEYDQLCQEGKMQVDIKGILQKNPNLAVRQAYWRTQNKIAADSCKVAEVFLQLSSYDYDRFDADTKAYAKFFFEQLNLDQINLTTFTYPSELLLSAEAIRYAIIFQRDHREIANRINAYANNIISRQNLADEIKKLTKR